MKKRKFSIQELSLKRRIWVAVSLVTFIPVIVMFYYFSGFYIALPTIVVALLIVILGWFLVFEVFSSIVRVYSNSKKTLKNIGEEPLAVDNEVQSLESIINILSSKMRSGLDQLKDFSQKADELNREVSKKVFVLSTILQANDLFSKEVPSQEILQFLTQRLTEIVGMKITFCSLLDESSGKYNIVSYFGVDAAKVEENISLDGQDIYKLKKVIILDKNNKNFPYVKFASAFGINNMIIVPIVSKGQQVGLIVTGVRNDNFTFIDDDFNILNLFSQNMAIIWEHNRLSLKVDELEVFDYLTGLYNEKYIEKRLDEEIVRALSYQRPCGFLLMEISNYNEYKEKTGPIDAEKLVKKTAKIFKEAIRPIDVVGRLGANCICVILIEKNKRQSQAVAKELQTKIENNFKDQVKLSFSIAENPIDGTTAKELILFAESHIKASGANEIS